MFNINTLPKSLVESADRILNIPDEPAKISQQQKMIDVDGDMKHTTNSNGDLIHSTEDGIRNFHRWFGNGLTDEHGRPKVFYHGTNAHEYTGGTIHNFHTRPNSGRGAAFFSDSHDLASQYGKTVYPVYLRGSNHLHVDANGRGWSDLDPDSKISGHPTPELVNHFGKRANEMNSLFKDMSELFPDEPDGNDVKPKLTSDHTSISHLKLSDLDVGNETDTVAKGARKHGFTGVVFHNVYDSPVHDKNLYDRKKSTVVAMYNPNDIKSVDNVGTFDPKNGIRG